MTFDRTARLLAILVLVPSLPVLAGSVPGQGRPVGQSVSKQPAAAKPVPSSGATKQGSLGSKDPGLFNLTGSIYFLEKGARQMPADLATRKVEGVIYADRIDVPVRRFTEGFPGITDRFEWFGILYGGRFFVDVPGKYTWTVRSDDGSRVWIDGQQVIDNDGIHGFVPKATGIELTEGPHDLRLWYFQGPATEIGFQLFITPPNGKQKIFDLADFAGPMAAAVKSLKAEATPDGIRIRLDAALLFDTAKWNLKPRAQQAIKNLSQVVAGYPNARVRIVGYTDAVGGEEYNLDLSRSRSQSVKDALAALGPPPGVTFETEGLGKADPVASNDTPGGRALNRRVEVFIKPLAGGAFDATAMPEVQTQRVRQPGEPARTAPDPAKQEAFPSPGAGPSGGAKPMSPGTIAVVNRIKYVIEQYVTALNARDEEALAQVRTTVTDVERELLKSNGKVTIDIGDVQVSGTTATAACQVAGASPPSGQLRVFHLARRLNGWIITDVR